MTHWFLENIAPSSLLSPGVIMLWEGVALLAQDAAPAPAAGAEPGGLFSQGMALPLMLTLMLAYFMFMLPDRKRQKELEKQLAGLKKNDSVVTSGGICGIVVNVSPESKYVTIRVDESNNTKLKILRSHIAHVGGPEESDAGKKESNA